MSETTNATNAPSTAPPKSPYQDEEFEAFLKMIGDGNIRYWSIMADALGVSHATIKRWKNHPLAKEALRTAIADSLEGMEKSGKDDWKMHREKAKMLGVKDKTTIEHEIDPETITDLLDTLGSNYDDLAGKARQAIVGQVVAPNAPIQNQG